MSTFEADAGAAAAAVGRQADVSLAAEHGARVAADSAAAQLTTQLQQATSRATAAEQTVATLTAQHQADAAAAASAAAVAAQVIAGLRAQLAQYRPPILYGISGGTDQAASVALVGARRVRTYNGQQLAQAVSAGLGVAHSEKLDQAGLARRDKAVIADAIARYKPMLDLSDQTATFNHERNNDVWKASSKDPNDPKILAAILADAAEYQAAWAVFLSDVLPAVNAGRLHPLQSCDVVTSSVFQIPGGLAPWRVLAADLSGYDCYDPGNWPKIHDAQVALGRKPWALLETGCVAGGTPGAWSDPAMLSRLKSDQATYAGSDLPPRFAFQFNNNGSRIQAAPLSAAYWHTLCALG